MKTRFFEPNTIYCKTRRWSIFRSIFIRSFIRVEKNPKVWQWLEEEARERSVVYFQNWFRNAMRLSLVSMNCLKQFNLCSMLWWPKMLLVSSNINGNRLRPSERLIRFVVCLQKWWFGARIGFPTEEIRGTSCHWSMTIDRSMNGWMFSSLCVQSSRRKRPELRLRNGDFKQCFSIFSVQMNVSFSMWEKVAGWRRAMTEAVSERFDNRSVLAPRLNEAWSMVSTRLLVTSTIAEIILGRRPI